MNPELFRLGPLSVSSLGVLLLLAFWIGITMAQRRSAAAGVSAGALLDLGLYMIIAGIIGGLLALMVLNLGTVTTEPLAIVALWRSPGPPFYGGLLGAGFVAWVYTRSRGISLGRLLDAVAPGLAVGYAVGMIGVALGSTPQTPLLMGRPTGAPWAWEVGFERVHPTQAYLLAAAVGIYVVLRFQRESAPGVLFLTFLFLQATSRFVVDFFVQSAPLLGPFTMAHTASAVVALLSLAGLIVAARRAPAGVGAGSAAGPAGGPPQP